MPEAVQQAGSGAKTVHSLAAAIRVARIEAAERGQAVAELRSAERARLEVLKESLTPLLAQVPADVDIFDAALSGGEQPRLFIDMIGFIEMGRDRRLYRFMQDTRHGRLAIAESERIEPIVEAVRNYIARRLVERERALASDQTLEEAARALASQTARPSIISAKDSPSGPATANRPSQRLAIFAAMATATRFLIEFLGAFMFGILVLAAAFLAYAPLRAWVGQLSGLPAL